MRKYLPKDIVFLEHWQEPSDHRANYLPGLAYDAYAKLVAYEKATAEGAQHPNLDRQYHYLGREALWTGRPRTAIKILLEHIAMNRWPAERAQSMIFAGDACGAIGQPEEQSVWYHRAFELDPTRRESLLRLAGLYKQQDKPHATAAYAAGALQLPYHGFYANQMSDYTVTPHAYLYHAKGWMGDVAGAQHHILEVLRYQPFNAEANRDVKFYFEYDVTTAPEGWMVAEELLWLHDNAKGKERILEVGSWKGRSTHALATGAGKTGGTVWAVDHFSGSVGEDVQHAEAKADPDSVYRQFMDNLKDCKNVIVHRADSLEAAKCYPDGYFDLLFLDGSHDYESVKSDLLAWGRKCSGLLAGHDFADSWPGVVRAVREVVGEPDSVRGSIWSKRVSAPPINPLLLYLADCVRKGLPVTFTKVGDGESLCMNGEAGANCDGHPYTKALADKLRTAFWQLEQRQREQKDGRTWVNVVPFADQPFFNCILHRNTNNLDAVKEFWGAIRDSDKPKVFVGPKRLKPAADMLKAEFVEVPLVNAFAEYERIREQLLWKAKGEAIFVFCAGMTSKVLIAELLKGQPNLTCIDAGSAFDPLFVEGGTRTEQLPRELLKREYAEWFPKAKPEPPKGNKVISVGGDSAAFPRVSILLPTLGREAKLERLLKLIPETVEWPNFEVVVLQDSFPPHNTGVPKLVKIGVEGTASPLIVYLGNDVLPQAGWLRIAVEAMKEHFPDLDGLIGLNDQFWEVGEVATHWLAGRKLLPLVDMELFHTGYFHIACDCELTERARQAGKFVWCEEAKVYHDHPIQHGFPDSEIDAVYALAYNTERGDADRALWKKRSEEIGFPIRQNFRRPMLPRRIFTIWLGGEMPDLVKKCVKTHELPGWEHRLITLENCPRDIPYVEQAIAAKKWVKAVDYLKLWLLIQEGGVYVDADVELLKPFPDEMMTDRLFAGLERNGWIGNGVIGATGGHPILKRCLERVEREFRGDDDKNFESSVQVFTETVYAHDLAANAVHLYEPEMFTPYDHQGKTVNITDKTVAYHHFMVTWGYPTVHPTIDLRTRLGDLTGKRVLNIGIGSGESGLAIQLPAYPFEKLDHIEVHQPYIEKARTKFWVAKEVNFHLGDAREFPVENYDLVLAFDVLEHLTKEDALALIARCPNMAVFIPLEPRPMCHREGVDDIASQDHLSIWTEQEFKDLGFQTEVLYGFHHEGGEVYPAMWAMRGFLDKRAGAEQCGDAFARGWGVHA